MRHPILIPVIAVCAMLASCGPKVSLMGTRPAEVGLPGVKTLYVMKFNGEYGFDARRCLLAVLAASDRFTVRDQEIDGRPDLAWADVRGSADARVDEARGYDTVNWEETKNRYVTIYDADGRPHEYLEVVREYKSERVEYVDRTEILTATVSVEHAERGFREEKSAARSIFTKFGGAQTHPKSSLYQASAPRLSALGSSGMQLGTYACDMGTRLARRLIPEAYVIDVRLADDGGELVQAGVEHAGQGDWPAAEQAWKQALAENPANAAAIYDLGVAAERGGSGLFEQAREHYERAAALDDASIYADGVTRINERIAEAARLQLQLAD